MKSLSFLLLMNLKNRVKELFRRPASLIFLLILCALLALMFVGSSKTATAGQNYRPITELFAMTLGLYTFVFGAGVLQGLSSGASFFSMADVNLLFSTPLAPRRVLLYGLIKQMGTSLYIGLFLLFQYSWLHQSYAISIAELLVILLGYGLCMFCSQLTAMAIYSFTSQYERAQTAVRIGIFVVFGTFILSFILPALQNQNDIFGSIVATANASPALLLPVAGWLCAAAAGVLTGSWLPVLLGLGATALFAAVLVFAVAKARGDFYEDVLLATGVSFTAITAKKEGKLSEAPPRNVKVGKTGIGKGLGSNAFYYKHMLENRRSRFFLLDTTSALFLLINWGFAFLTRENGLIMILCFSVYLQIFTTATGRWVRELLLPFAYLVPEPPFRKLVNLCRESILKLAMESILLFVPVGFILGLSPQETAACIVMRIGFGLLFIAGNILIERILGSLTSKTIIMLLYFLIMLLLCIPGLVLGIVLMAVAGTSSYVLPLLVISLWNTACAAIIVFFCRDILSYAELNNR